MHDIPKVLNVDGDRVEFLLATDVEVNFIPMKMVGKKFIQRLSLGRC